MARKRTTGTEKLKPTALAKLAKTPGLHSDGRGLYLAVAKPPSTACSWVFRYMLAGRARTMGLGPYPELPLADARAAAYEARQTVKVQGKDPLEVRHAEKVAARVAVAKTMTFKQAAEQWLRDKDPGLKKGGKTADQRAAQLAAYVYPVFGPLPVSEIDTGLVMKVLKSDPEPLWFTRPETGWRVRWCIEKVLDWAETNGYRPPGKNPARWKGHLANLLPPRAKVAAVEGHAALSVDALPDFMTKLRTRPGLSARALELTILTAVRTSETLEARWAEFDLDKALWTIPAARMKASRDHRVGLSDQAVALLRDLKKETGAGEFVFPSEGGKPLSNNSMLALINRMGMKGKITTHGFRSTFRDWAAENGIAREVAEAVLAHAVGNKVEAAYLRSDILDRRRTVMQAWADFADGKAAAQNVQPLRQVGAA
jgi:integrase